MAEPLPVNANGVVMATSEDAEARVKRVLEGVTYKPGWSFYVKRWEDVVFIAAKHTEVCSRNPNVNFPDFERQVPIVWPLYTTSTDEAVLAWVRHCIHEWEIHEADEQLRFNGRHVHDPHLCHQCRIGGCRA